MARLRRQRDEGGGIEGGGGGDGGDDSGGGIEGGGGNVAAATSVAWTTHGEGHVLGGGVDPFGKKERAVWTGPQSGPKVALLEFALVPSFILLEHLVAS